jgi:hypothetical protein
MIENMTEGADTTNAQDQPRHPPKPKLLVLSVWFRGFGFDIDLVLVLVFKTWKKPN